MTEQKPTWQIILEILERVDVVLWGRVIRRMLYYLYTHNVLEISELVRQLEPFGNEAEGEDNAAARDNVPLPKIDADSLKRFAADVFRVAGKNLSAEEIEAQIRKWLSQEKTLFLSIITEKSNIPLAEIRDALDRFFKLKQEEIHMSPDERTNITVALIHRFLSDNLTYIRVTKQFLELSEFAWIMERTFGAARGQGKLGGKAAGMILAHRIIEKKKKRHPQLERIRLPRSWFLTSDSVIDFIHYNALEEVVSLKYMDVDEVRAGFPYLQHLFKNSFFSSEIIAQMGILIDQVGDHPIIVRSSSLLEDSYEASFSGKYKSFFLANLGSRSQRLSALLDAIAEIYASVFSPDPIEYRKERGLLDFQEEMGIMIQEVVGNRIGKYFFPTVSGVAFGTNEFPWSPRVGRSDGMVRMVVGLGTRAVDRLGDDYPFLAAPGKPSIRVNVSPENMLRYSQKKVDVLNLENGRFETLEVEVLLQETGGKIPGIETTLSIDQGGILVSPKKMIWDSSQTQASVTFQGMIEHPEFLSLLDTLLKTLQENMGCPVDVEFAWDGVDFYLLQCRVQQTRPEESDIRVPSGIAADRVLFSTTRYVTNASLKNIRFIVYVDPEAYGGLASAPAMRDVATAVFKLNRLLPPKQFILIGPGRWGSRGDIKLDVPVTYSDINNTAMLIEVAFSRGGYTPEVSFGTHFFQDLVESGIKYLPIFPEEPDNRFSERLLLDAPNSLSLLLPEMKALEPVLRLVDVRKLVPNGCLQVRMNQEAGKALAYISDE